MAKSRIEELYDDFIADFPYFNGKVRNYEKNGKNSLLITTIMNKKFVYKKTDKGVELGAV